MLGRIEMIPITKQKIIKKQIKGDKTCLKNVVISSEK